MRSRMASAICCCSMLACHPSGANCEQKTVERWNCQFSIISRRMVAWSKVKLVNNHSSITNKSTFLYVLSSLRKLTSTKFFATISLSSYSGRRIYATCKKLRQAAFPSAFDRYVFPDPVAPIKMTFLPSRI